MTKSAGTLRRRPGWEEIVRAVEKVRKEPWRKFANRRGDFGRDLALLLRRRAGGLTLSALGRQAGGMNVMAVSDAIKRLAKKVETNKEVRHALAATEKHWFNV